MRKVIVTEFLTLDGVYEDSTPWQQGYSPDSDQFKRDELFDSGALLLGRVTYEGFAAAWPERTDEAGFADKMNAMPKYVVSTTLEELTRESARLSDGETLLTHTVVWTAGVRASPAVAIVGVPTDDRGRIVVGPTLQVEGRERVWAIGDCARVPNEATPDHPDPPTSQHALRQARRLAKNLWGDPGPYRYRMLGQVATLGRGKGIADVLGLRLRGFPGWWVTRTYHLYQLPLFTRKLRVVVDWTVALFFRRDIAELGMLGRPRGLGD